jgi:NADPH2:quinone reductase
MIAAVYDEVGGPDVLRLQELPDPVPGPDEVVVRNEAISIEGRDCLLRAGAGGPPPFTPYVGGGQSAGTVVAVGEAVRDRSPGERVVCYAPEGGCAELRPVPARTCWPIPDGLAADEAACVPVAFGTAHECLHRVLRIAADERILVHGGASGVGVAAIQLAKAAGAEVFATASSDERLQALAPLGLDHGIDYTAVDFADEILHLTGGHGVDCVIDPVGGRTLPRTLVCLAERGRCVSIGNASREPVSIDPSGMRPRNQSLYGYHLQLMTDAATQDTIAALLGQVGRGELRVLIDRRLQLEDVATAHALIEARQVVGRIVLTVGGMS